MLRKLFPGVKWIHRGTALGISEGRKMETSIWWRLQLRQTSSTLAGPLWLSHEAIMTCSDWVDRECVCVWGGSCNIPPPPLSNNSNIDKHLNVNHLNLEIKTYLHRCFSCTHRITRVHGFMEAYIFKWSLAITEGCRGYRWFIFFCYY